MWAHTLNYRAQRGEKQHLVHRGFWLHNVPRLMLACRLVGHRPVVDGFDGRNPANSARWVACDRCGVRGEPQGSLDSQQWSVGQRYTGPWRREDLPADPGERFTALKSLKGVHYPPGPLEQRPTGTLGGEVAVGRTLKCFGFTLKVGNAGSEQTLAAAVHLWWASLYLHTERFGTWAQRRLNPTGYESKVIEVEIHHGRLWWKLWARRDGWSRSDPRWRRGSLPVNPLDMLLGQKRYSYTDVGAKVTETVYLPDGERHPVLLQLQMCTLGRKRWRKRDSWSVQWEAPRGIPTKPAGRGRIYGSSVDVSDMAVAAGMWPAAARARIAEEFIAKRARYDSAGAVG